MKVGHVTERTDASNASSFLDSDELERTGIDLGTTGRLQLMARLAEGENMCWHVYTQRPVLKILVEVLLPGCKLMLWCVCVSLPLTPSLSLSLPLTPSLSLPLTPSLSL